MKSLDLKKHSQLTFPGKLNYNYIPKQSRLFTCFMVNDSITLQITCAILEKFISNYLNVDHTSNNGDFVENGLKEFTFTVKQRLRTLCKTV